MNRLWYAHPFLVALIPALVLWNDNFFEIFFREVALSIFVLFVFAALLLFICRLILRERHRAALLSSAILLLTLSYQYIFGHLAALLGSNTYTFALAAVLLAVLAGFFWGLPRDLKAITAPVFVFSAVFAGMLMVQIGFQYYTSYSVVPPKEIEFEPEKTPQEKRDVYYIILDELTSPDILKNVMRHDIDEVVSRLEQQGFKFAEGVSNYTGTYDSLPSSLNLRYMEESDTPKRKAQMLEGHVLGQFFQDIGYKYVHFGSPWITYKNTQADRNINIIFWTEYQRLLFKNTIFAPINERLDFLDERKRHFSRVNYQLEELVKLADDKAPTFAFVHLFVPHVPYVFDENGNFLTLEEERSRSEVQNYVAAAKYITARTEKVAEEILAKSEIKPIIVIQGDHGFRFLHHRDESLAELELKEEDIPELTTRIFNAYYLPDGGDALLYPTITPVNSFRLILNRYFGQSLPLLPDKTFLPDPQDEKKTILFD